MTTIDWSNIFFNQGAPLLILGFILWFMVKPLFEAHVKNINKNTEILEDLVASCKEMKSQYEILHKRFEVLEDKLNLK